MPNRFAILAALALVACHEDSSSSSESLVPGIHDTGLALGGLMGEGDSWLVVVSESDQGRDLDGDGDQVDSVVQTLDLATGRTTSTGIVLGTSQFRGDVAPSQLVGFGSDFAVGASETQTGTDLNHDGDALDDVVMRVDPRSGAVTNLGLAVQSLKSSQRYFAFDVSEVAQGQDLDGDQVIDALVVIPFVHDRVTGETWNSGLSGARTVGIDEGFLAVVESESIVGDRDDDGDTDDEVLAFYDLNTRTLTSSGLALRQFLGFVSRPIPHRGAWAVHAETEAGFEVTVYDPRNGRSRAFPGLEVLPLADVAPFVLYLPVIDGSFESWLYDADTDALTPTNWAAVGIQGLGDQIVFDVSESDQSTDLDGNGRFTGFVPVVYDPASGRSRNTGVDGFPVAFTERLLILADEFRPQRDWNGDGDLDDAVLQIWDPASGRLDNTRFGTREAASLGERFALFLRNEGDAGKDLNGDGDLFDDVAHLYDSSTRKVVDLGWAAQLLFGFATSGSRGFLPVSEPAQGADLNGDGDRVDNVLFLVDPGTAEDSPQ